MAIETELQTASRADFKLYSLLKAAAFSAEELEPEEAKELFSMAFKLSDTVTAYLHEKECEVQENGQ